MQTSANFGRGNHCNFCTSGIHRFVPNLEVEYLLSKSPLLSENPKHTVTFHLAKTWETAPIFFISVLTWKAVTPLNLLGIQERIRVVHSSRVARKLPARWHSHNGFDRDGVRTHKKGHKKKPDKTLNIKTQHVKTK